MINIVDSTLQVVVNDSAGKVDIQIATNRATVEDDGMVVPASLHQAGEGAGIQDNGALH